MDRAEFLKCNLPLRDVGAHIASVHKRKVARNGRLLVGVPERGICNEVARRIEAMEKALAAFGVGTWSTEDSVTVIGTDAPFAPCEIDSVNDHRIAMAAAIASMRADGPVLIHGAGCVAKSYPAFFDDLARLQQSRDK